MRVFICCLAWLQEGDFLTILIYDYVVGTIQDSATTSPASHWQCRRLQSSYFLDKHTGKIITWWLKEDRHVYEKAMWFPWQQLWISVFLSIGPFVF